METLLDWAYLATLRSSIAILALLCIRELCYRWQLNRYIYPLWLSIPVAMLLPPAAPTLQLEFLTINQPEFILPAGAVTQTAQPTPMGFWLLGLWCLGAVYFAGRYLARQYLIRSRWLKDSSIQPGTDYWIAPNAPGPFCYGGLKPKIYIPPLLFEQYTTTELSLILQHERVHSRRFDPLWNHLAEICCILFWFNPLLWIAARRFLTDQEISCDRRTLEQNQSTNAAYSSLLLKAYRNQHSIGSAMAAAPTIKERMMNLKLPQRTKPANLASSLIAASLLYVFTMGSVISAGDATNTANSARRSAEGDVIPLVRIQPRYPSEALEAKLEGWVAVELTVTVHGTVRDPRVITAEPAGVFDQEATRAILKWKYKPRIVDGAAVERRLIQVLEFKLANLEDDNLGIYNAH